jgi:hypothetical protein
MQEIVPDHLALMQKTCHIIPETCHGPTMTLVVTQESAKKSVHRNLAIPQGPTEILKGTPIKQLGEPTP